MPDLELENLAREKDFKAVIEGNRINYPKKRRQDRPAAAFRLHIGTFWSIIR